MEPRLLRLGGQPAFLAAGYLKQSGVQTAISVGALITAVALFTALVVMIHSFRSTVALWVQQSIAGDIYIRPKLAELNRFRDPLPPRVVAGGQESAGVRGTGADASPGIACQRSPAPFRGHGLRRLCPAQPIYLDGRRHPADGSRSNRGQGRRRIGGLRQRHRFESWRPLSGADRRRPLLDAPILGVFRDYRTRGGAVYYSLPHYQEQFQRSMAWSGVQVNLTDQRPAVWASKTVAQRRRCWPAAGMTIEMMEGQKLRDAVLRIFDETFAITTVLLMIALAVAALGIATTLAVMVLQRSRQLNTIRAVGGSKGQLRSMILWEAAMIVVAGQAAGLACGFMLSYLLIFVVNLQSFGWTFLYGVDWPGLLTALPLIFAAALLAALPAVRMALNASPAVLLRGEAR
jgi:putative ABC transport system permease protein